MVVAADDARILQACSRHGVEAVLTRTDHVSGSDRLAEACALLDIDGDDVVVNVQGDEPLIEPRLVARCAQLLRERDDCVMSTAAHPIVERADFLNPNIVKVVLDAAGPRAVLQPRADPVRRAMATARCRSRRRCATSACMAIALGSCGAFRS